jgi:hypothetical protein
LYLYPSTGTVYTGTIVGDVTNVTFQGYGLNSFDSSSGTAKYLSFALDPANKRINISYTESGAVVSGFHFHIAGTVLDYDGQTGGDVLGNSFVGGICVAIGTDPVAVAAGGTGITTCAEGDLLYGSAADTISTLSIGTAGQFLWVNAGATAPEWRTLNAPDVSFTATTAGDWAGGVPPTNLQDALDRLAAACNAAGFPP